MPSSSENMRETRSSKNAQDDRTTTQTLIDLTPSSPEEALPQDDDIRPPVYILHSMTPDLNKTGLRSSVALLKPGTKLPQLSTSDLRLLHQKQKKLASSIKQTLNSVQKSLLPALLSTLIFASPESGTAVLVHHSGIVLTCAHCFAESKFEYESLTLRNGKRKWALFYDGTAVLLELVIWDGRRDLALCRIVSLEATTPASSSSSSTTSNPATHPNFHALSVSRTAPKRGVKIFCIGQPGAEDLESDVPGTKTKYNLFEISEGRYRGLVRGQDVHDNEEIGAMMHDAWTYWGHSGAPLITLDEMRDVVGLAGLHSSWDDQTAMRHGVPWEAIHMFLADCESRLGVRF